MQVAVRSIFEAPEGHTARLQKGMPYGYLGAGPQC